VNKEDITSLQLEFAGRCHIQLHKTEDQGKQQFNADHFLVSCYDFV